MMLTAGNQLADVSRRIKVLLIPRGIAKNEATAGLIGDIILPAQTSLMTADQVHKRSRR